MGTSFTIPPPAVSLPIPASPALRPCESWCLDGAGHANEMPGDRGCRSENLDLPVSLGKPFELEDGWWSLDHMSVGLRRDEWDGEARAIVHHVGDAHDHVLELTLEEASALAAALLRSVALAAPTVDGGEDH